jgi:antitoxin (DNA-binding transcriptional repressor) of toxin-antitoxin stability system
MEMQHNLARVLREIEAGHEVGITRRRKLVARMLPPAQPPPVDLPAFTTRARKVWGKVWKGCSSDDLLGESRGSR